MEFSVEKQADILHRKMTNVIQDFFEYHAKFEEVTGEDYMVMCEAVRIATFGIVEECYFNLYDLIRGEGRDEFIENLFKQEMQELQEVFLQHFDNEKDKST